MDLKRNVPFQNGVHATRLQMSLGGDVYRLRSVRKEKNTNFEMLFPAPIYVISFNSFFSFYFWAHQNKKRHLSTTKLVIFEKKQQLSSTHM